MSSKRYILALDQGTTSSRAIVFDEECHIKSVAQAEYAQVYPREGWVEHDPTEIYSSVASVTSEALVRAGINRSSLAAIGITNQRETTIVWDKLTGQPVYNAIVWQCRRTAEVCDKIKADGYEKTVFDKTGLPVDAYFSATKIAWILNNVSGAREKAERGELLFGTVDTYLMWKLSAGKVFATDYTNASRTMLFNIHTLSWDDELLELFGVPRRMLPSVQPSGSLFGYTDAEVFGARIAMAGVAGDQQSALFGQKCFSRGMSKCTFGTGCFLLTNTGDEAVKSKHGLVTTLAASVNEKPMYALEGSVFVGGAAVQWLRDSLRMIHTAAESETYALKVEDTLGVYVVPAFVGLGAPYWDPYARGTITGITRGTTKEHIVRATLESIAYQVNDVLSAMEKDCGATVTKLAADGGASANGFLMQFMSDISDRPVVRPEIVETTALGAACLAGLTFGLFDMDELEHRAGNDVEFYPRITEEKRAALLSGWTDAVARSRG